MVILFFVCLLFSLVVVYFIITSIFPDTKLNSYRKEREKRINYKLSSFKIKDVEKYLRKEKLKKLK